jgi:hypothetical protein
MGKAISLFYCGKRWGTYSNKTNAWLAIKATLDESGLCVWHEKKEEFRPVSYSVLAARLGNEGKCLIYKNEDIATAAETASSESSESVTPAKPCFYVYQDEMNVCPNGKLYKSSDKSQKSEEKNGTNETNDTNEADDTDETNEEQDNPTIPEVPSGEANENDETVVG